MTFNMACLFMPNLEQLFMDMNLLACGAAKAIARVVMEGGLSNIKLRLDDNHIRNPGTKVLCDMLSTTDTLPDLAVFTLHHNIIGDGVYAKLFAEEWRANFKASTWICTSSTTRSTTTSGLGRKRTAPQLAP